MWQYSLSSQLICCSALRHFFALKKSTHIWLLYKAAAGAFFCCFFFGHSFNEFLLTTVINKCYWPLDSRRNEVNVWADGFSESNMNNQISSWSHLNCTWHRSCPLDMWEPFNYGGASCAQTTRWSLSAAFSELFRAATGLRYLCIFCVWFFFFFLASEGAQSPLSSSVNPSGGNEEAGVVRFSAACTSWWMSLQAWSALWNVPSRSPECTGQEQELLLSILGICQRRSQTCPEVCRVHLSHRSRVLTLSYKASICSLALSYLATVVLFT